MNNLFQVFIVLMIGVALRRVSAFNDRRPSTKSWLIAVPDNLADSLTSFVLYVSLPATILLKIPGLAISTDLLVPVILPWVMLAISVVLVVVLSRLFRWPRRVKGLMLLLVPLGNTSFLGIPMVTAFFGEEYVEYALVYDQVGTFLALATFGAAIAAVYGGGDSAAALQRQSAENDASVVPSGSGRTAAALIRIAAFPPFVALVLSLATRAVPYPAPLVSVLEALSATLVPIVIAAVGFKLELHVHAAHRKPLGVGLGLKLVVAPLIALAGCRMLGLSGPAVDVSVFEAGMPSQVAAWAVAMKAGLEPELGAAMVGFGILASFVTLTGLFQLL
jgi:predicted permease